MQKFVVAAIVACCLTSIASAADVGAPLSIVSPVRYAANTPSLHNWSGLYVGINGAYGMPSSYDTSFSGSATDSFKSKAGYIFGVTAGANAQFGKWVAGLESDLGLASGFNADRESRGCFGPGCSVKTKTTEHENLQWLGTTRVRVGYLFFDDKVLAYATGGVAYGALKDSTTFTCTICTRVQIDSSRFGVGWTLGGGAEYALSPRLSAKVEYLYVSLYGDSDITKIAGGRFSTKHSFDDHIIRAGLNFKLN